MANQKHSLLWNEIFKLRGITPKERKIALDFISKLEKHEILYKKHLKDGTEFKCQYHLIKKSWSDDQDGYPYKSVFQKDRLACNILANLFPWDSTKDSHSLPGLSFRQARELWLRINSLLEQVQITKKAYEDRIKKLKKSKEAK